MSKVSPKDGVTYVCDSLQAFGIDYITPDDFKSAKNDEPQSKPTFQRLAADVLTLGLADFSCKLASDRSYQNSMKAVSVYCALRGVHIDDDSSTVETMLISCWLLASFGERWIRGYRKLLVGATPDDLNLDSYRSHAVGKAAAEESRTMATKLESLTDPTVVALMQLLNKLRYLQRLKRDLIDEKAKVISRIPAHVGKWLLDQTEDQKIDVIKDISFQAHAVKETAFWNWLTPLIEANAELFSDACSPSETHEPPESADTADLDAVLSRADRCLTLVAQRGIIVTRGFSGFRQLPTLSRGD